MLNKVILQGRLTADPELKQTQSGVSVCSFTVACDRDYTPQGQEKQADFISVVAWRHTAEFVSKYFAKGRMIIVEGSLRTRNYPDSRHPEVKHYVTEVYADKVSFCGGKNESGGAAKQTVQRPAQTAPIADLSDFEEVSAGEDLPF